MIITVRVKPGSKKGNLVEQIDEHSFLIYLRARAHDGEANSALIGVLADYFNVPKTSIKIKSGTASRIKTIEL